MAGGRVIINALESFGRRALVLAERPVQSAVESSESASSKLTSNVIVDQKRHLKPQRYPPASHLR